MFIDIERISEDIDKKNLPLREYLDSLVNLPNDVSFLYQYTSIEALYNGIIVKNPVKDKEICIWASNCEYMNDPDEVKTGRKFAEKMFKLSDYEANQAMLKVEENIKEKMFITSFSSVQDNLPMWRMYGNNCKGIALGFDAQAIFNEFKGLIYKCIYIDSHHEIEINEFFKDNVDIDLSNNEKLKENIDRLLMSCLKNLANFIHIFVGGIFLAKNPCYNYEKEYRLFIIAEQKIEYRYNNNLIIPYIRNYFPKSALKEIWIGPANNMERTEKSLKRFLNAMGLGHVEIKKSQIPYRG